MSIVESVPKVNESISVYESMKRTIIVKKFDSEPVMRLCNCQRFSKYKTSSDCICMKDRSKDVDGEFEKARIGFEANNARLGIDKLTAAFLTFADNQSEQKSKDSSTPEDALEPSIMGDESPKSSDSEDIEEIIDETNFRNYV